MAATVQPYSHDNFQSFPQTIARRMIRIAIQPSMLNKSGQCTLVRRREGALQTTATLGKYLLPAQLSPKFEL